MEHFDQQFVIEALHLNEIYHILHICNDFVALLMFLFSSISSAQVMFIDLELDDENQAFANGRSDTDGDGVLDSADSCVDGESGWTSNTFTDHDGDGCKDDVEDSDDDNDSIADGSDSCSTGDTSWTSNSSTDNDGDGCRDSTEDNDDDNDGLGDSSDSCPAGDTGWTSNSGTDHDSDGCRDDGSEDTDDDGDGVADLDDACPRGNTGWTSSSPSTDLDGDGCQDSTEDSDDDGDGVADLAVGAIDYDGGSYRGAVYILFLNADGSVRAETKISSTQGGLTGPLGYADYFGASVASLGDLDGDGVPDLAVGASHDDDGGSYRGAVYILFLNADGSVKAETKISNTQGGLTGRLDDVDLFGISVASLGDLDGDGVADLVVGAERDDDGGTDVGAVYILFLNADGTVKDEMKLSASTVRGAPLCPRPAIRMHTRRPPCPPDEMGCAHSPPSAP